MKRQMKSQFSLMGASRVFIIIIIIICLMSPVFLIFSASFLSGPSSPLQDQVHEEDKTKTGIQSLPVLFGYRKMKANGRCTKRDISISQSKGPSSGIPQYIVQIVNTCSLSGCSPSHIHFHCGWFASARIVNPNTFKRLSYDDCLVNAGRPLRYSQIIRFTYTNSFMYPLAFKSARFSC